MNDKGWVRLWREQFSHSVSDNKPWCDGYAWCYLYSQANFKKGIVNFRNEYIEIERGQFLTSQLKLAEKWGWTRKHVKTFLNSLKNDEMLTIRTTNRFIIITISNYGRYQSYEEKNDQQNGQQGIQQKRNRSATEAQQKHTIEEVKNEKNIYREEILKKNSQLTERFQEKIKILKDEISDESYKQWIAPLLFVGMEDDKVILYHETPIWVQENYATMIEKIIGKSVKIINEPINELLLK